MFFQTGFLATGVVKVFIFQLFIVITGAHSEWEEPRGRTRMIIVYVGALTLQNGRIWRWEVCPALKYKWCPK